MRTAIDTNILLDILLPDVAHVEHSMAMLHRAASEGVLLICEVVAAELGAHFAEPESMNNFFSETSILLKPMSLKALHDAGRRWRKHRSGQSAARERVVADFMIATHALHEADRLLTRDLGFYRSQFKDLTLLQ